MAKICLPKEIADKFRKSLKNGDIDPKELSTMSSKDRRVFFTKIIGEEYAISANALFESKLLLKNQQRGLINWAQNVAGMKPEQRRDLLNKISKMTDILDSDSFYEDLASTKLGVQITNKEASDISSLAKEALDAKLKMESSMRRTPDGLPTKAELEYGIKTVRLNNYVNDLKVKTEQISAKEFLFNPKKATMEVAGITKSLKSSIDNSALLRQGIKTFFSSPKQWWKNAPKTFSDIKKVFQKKEAMDLLNAEIISDPLYDTMKKAKVAVGSIEEAFPTRSPEMIPIFGKFFKASDAAYSGFLHRMRVDLFKKYYKIAEKNGINLNSKKELEGIGALVNSLTGRGKLPGAAEGAANFLNVTMFSPRNLQSNIDFLTGFAGRDVSNFAKKQMAISLVKTIAGIGSVLQLASILWPGSVESDPRSSDFGKIKIRKTRFDVSGGNAGLITLAMRLATNSTKSSTSGKVTELGTGDFGSRTRKDVLFDFMENKSSPLLSEILDRLENETFSGEKPTISSTLINLTAPLSIENMFETAEEKDRANLLLIGISDLSGVGTQTY